VAVELPFYLATNKGSNVMIIKEPIGKITVKMPFIETFKGIEDFIFRSRYSLFQSDSAAGTIMIKEHTIFSLLLYKCYCDKILFKISSLGKDESEIVIYTIPNLFKYKLEKNDMHKIINKSELIEKLKSHFRHCG
jgi:hypothetical protein